MSATKNTNSDTYFPYSWSSAQDPMRFRLGLNSELDFGMVRAIYGTPYALSLVYRVFLKRCCRYISITLFNRVGFWPPSLKHRDNALHRQQR
ncbi:MAG: hypothetical protein CM15mP120_11070 [Pseudomonadota bacterium]|nr:MAG: hypothetical protein CM15mP120_11070 [Pseudomonadota bacterium]